MALVHRRAACATLSVLLLAGQASAQQLAYLVDWAGPAVSLSRCAISPQSCHGRIHVVDLDAGQLIATLPGQYGTGNSLVASADERQLVWRGGFGSGLNVYHRGSATQMLVVGSYGGAHDIALASGGTGKIILDWSGNRLRALDLAQPGSLVINFSIPLGHGFGFARPVVAAPGGSPIYAATPTALAVVDVPSQTVQYVPLPGQSSWAVALSGDGTRVFVTRSAGLYHWAPGQTSLHVVDTATLQVLGSRELTAPGDLQVSTDGLSIWTSDGSYDVQVFSAPAVRKLNATTLAEEAYIPMPGPVGGMTIGKTDGRLVVETGPVLAVVETTSATITRLINVPSGIRRAPAVVSPTAPCLYSVPQPEVVLPAAGGSGSFTIATDADCPWSVVSPIGYFAWPLLVGPLPSGVGPAALTFSASPNLAASPRLASYYLKGPGFAVGQSLAVQQLGMVTGPAGSPGAPSNLTVRVRAGGIVALHWEPPIDGPAPGRYIVEAGTVHGERDVAVVDVGQATSLTAGPLPGKYFPLSIRVRGINAIGMGPASNEVRVLYDWLRPPTGLQLLWQTPLHGQVRWQEPWVSAERYQLEVGSVAGASDLGVFAVADPLLEVDAASVPRGRYFIRVRGIGSQGRAGEPSQDVQALVGICDTAPSTPTAVHVGVGPGRVASVSIAVESPQPFTAFRLRVGRSPGADDVGVFDLSSPTASGVLLPGRYFLRASTVNACGESPASVEQTFDVP